MGDTVNVLVIAPYGTALVLVLASMFSVSVSMVTRFRPLLYLGIGLFAVAIQSALDGYLLQEVDARGGWDSVPGNLRSFYLFLDAVRGFVIVFWAAIEVVVVLDLLGMEGRTGLLARLIPIAIILFGLLYTTAINFSSIEPLSKRILISSAGRVFIILIPSALAAGIVVLSRLWKPTGNRGFLALGVAFLLHAITLPFYSLAKESGLITFSLWYLIGGVIPGLVALASLYAISEDREAIAILSMR